jgi:hypothetical protein
VGLDPEYGDLARVQRRVRSNVGTMESEIDKREARTLVRCDHGSRTQLAIGLMLRRGLQVRCRVVGSEVKGIDVWMNNKEHQRKQSA